MQENLTKDSCFSSGRLILGPDSECSSVEMEIIRSSSGIRLYVNLLYLQAPPQIEDPSRTSIEIIFDDQETWRINPYLLRGGQRLLIPGEVADKLIQRLLEGDKFNLNIGRFSLTVICDEFMQSYTRLLALPISYAKRNN